MGIRFNAEEVFEIAERIEKNAARFCRRAAELRPEAEKDNIDFLLGLAAMEEEHDKILAGMRGQLTGRMREETAADPYLEAHLYLNELADASGGEGSQAAADALTGAESIVDILKILIRLEQKSISFYLGIKDMVPASLGKDKIDDIIAEERNHIVILAEKLISLK